MWHPSQTIEDLPDGGYLLRLRTNPLEITPWLRGWGPDVEVLEPQSLREEFRKWADQLHGMYQQP